MGTILEAFRRIQLQMREVNNDKYNSHKCIITLHKQFMKPGFVLAVPGSSHKTPLRGFIIYVFM